DDQDVAGVVGRHGHYRERSLIAIKRGGAGQFRHAPRAAPVDGSAVGAVELATRRWATSRRSSMRVPHSSGYPQRAIRLRYPAIRCSNMTFQSAVNRIVIVSILLALGCASNAPRA